MHSDDPDPSDDLRERWAMLAAYLTAALWIGLFAVIIVLMSLWPKTT